MIWTEKYKPQKLSDVVGDRGVLEQLEDFILNYRNHKKNSVILHGMTGTGKTCSVHAIAKENNLELMELNASDFRNKAHINDIIGFSINQASLFNKGKIILIDEIDGLSGMKDRGGAQALASLLSSSAFPVVLTANDVYQDKLSGLRSKSILLEFENLKNNEMLEVLKKIVDKENVKIDDLFLKKLVGRSGGDLRSAINDLQILCALKKINEEDVEYLGDRRKEQEIFALLRLIFKSKELDLISKTCDDVDLNFDEMFLWIDENLPFEYSGKELSRAYDMLSKADVFRGRIRRWQHWRFLVYQKFFMNEGVALAKDVSKKGYVKYRRTQRLLKIWRSKMKYGKRKSICAKIADKMHVSTKRAMKDIFPYVKNLLKKDEFVNKFDFDDDEVSWLVKNY
ncbi:MAG: replication factor C large subunit [Candidatus Woesearchaeota archaeon]